MLSKTNKNINDEIILIKKTLNSYNCELNSINSNLDINDLENNDEKYNIIIAVLVSIALIIFIYATV
jgi:hypothetical protein